MELGLLNLMPAAASPDEAGLAPGRIGDADAFTQLLAQLGLAPTAEAIPATPEALVAALAQQVSGKPIAATQPATEDGAGEAPVAEPDTEASAASADAPPLDPAALGLPPLIAALFAPAAAPATESPAAAPAPAPSVAQPLPTGAAPVPLVAAVASAAVTTIPATPQAAMPEAVAPDATPVVKTSVADPAIEARTALAMPLPQAAPAAVAMAAELPRHLRPVSLAPATTIDAGPAPAAEKPAVAAADLTSLVTVKAAPLPLTPLAPVTIDAPQQAIPTAEAPPALEMPIEPHLDLARDGEWLDQLARDIARTASADGQLRFKLNPEHLGSLHVELRSGASGASVRLTADTEAARSIIADARPQLIAEARAQGVRISEAHVDLGSNGQSPGGGHPRDGRELPPRTYLTSWKPDSVEEGSTPPRRSASERYA